MKLSKECIQQIPNKPGIYLITNTTNGKHYVGQAIDLRKRLYKHFYSMSNNRLQKYPLYKAAEKYGIESFELRILSILTNYENYSKETIKKGLDKLEIYYIKKYDSYNKGYNQTLGGDKGTLGFKMTEEQKDKLRENSKKHAADGRYTIYCLNIETKEIIKSVNLQELSNVLNLQYDTVKRAKIYKKILNNTYYISDNENILEEFEKETNLENITSRNTEKLLLDYYNSITSLNRILSIKEICELLNISKETVIKRNRKLRELGYKLPIKSRNKIDHIEIRSIKNNEVIKTSIDGVADMFGISKESAKKQVRNENIYRKEYYFTIVYE